VGNSSFAVVKLHLTLVKVEKSAVPKFYMSSLSIIKYTATSYDFWK
jgi:hypothetical protein